MSLRQWWKDWNTSAESIDEMAVLPKKIEQFILQKSTHYDTKRNK